MYNYKQEWKYPVNEEQESSFDYPPFDGQNASNTISNSTNLRKLVLFCFFIFISFSLQGTTVTYEAILPEHIPVENIACIDIIIQDDASTIYKIETLDGDVLYQVVSVVIMKALPTGIELACNYLVKSPAFCKYVKYAGEALIGIYKDDIKEMITHWTTKRFGGMGVAKVYSSDYAGAEDAHMSFRLSKNDQGFPWGAPEVEKYRDMNFSN